ncbi:Hsp20/alpha crystallin family protein [Methanogenium cariaci]|uniref:Hsp20/alpha crystallin family protein n=1 Tax=Methanogenium cariaci TaxID=2197 RepID=UPI0007834EA7|nr:Hsp20/alpha crystallin family protein [Methanogenium cariaci]
MMRRPYRWSVYDEFEEMRREMDQLMSMVPSSSFYSPSSLALPEAEQRAEIVPLFREVGGFGGFQVDVTQDENEVIVAADMMPGIEKENISMQLISPPKALEITCERKEEREVKEGMPGEEGAQAEGEQGERGGAERYYLHERKYGSISRIVPLPRAVTTEGAKASFRNGGVLEVRLPSSALEMKRRIAIE